MFAGVVLWYAWKWQPFFKPVKEQQVYMVQGHNSDTLLIGMIGDSWTGLHKAWHSDSLVSDEWTTQLGRPVRFASCGKGGANSGDIYRLMFRQNLPIDSFTSQDLLMQRPDYCVLTVGINDANQNAGTKYYCANYHLIIRHLLKCGIRPIIIEVPDVDLEHVYGDKPLKDRISDAYKSILIGTKLYNVSTYRQAWKNYLDKSGLIDSVIYIGHNSWNPKGFRDSALYLQDRIHLNGQGYARLDSCVISIIQSEQQ
jgi:lysophospholipase L1-like esterase